MKLTAIHVYPIKSVAGMSVSTAEIEARGIKHDRRWMVVDEGGRFVTGRVLPKMVLIQAIPDEQGLQLDAPDMPTLYVQKPHIPVQRITVKVWNDEVSAVLADAASHAWLSQYLGRELRLVFMDDTSQRHVEILPPHTPAIQSVSFADGYPLLLISDASLAHLNQKLAAPITMQHFRPNLVISAEEPHIEDSWKSIRINNVEFDLVKTCTRCVFTTVNPSTGEKDSTGEPLNTLKTYRRSGAGVIFGMNLIARSMGSIHTGDSLQVLA